MKTNCGYGLKFDLFKKLSNVFIRCLILETFDLCLSEFNYTILESIFIFYFYIIFFIDKSKNYNCTNNLDI